MDKALCGGGERIEQAEGRTDEIVWGGGEEFENKAASQVSVDQGVRDCPFIAVWRVLVIRGICPMRKG